MKNSIQISTRHKRYYYLVLFFVGFAINLIWEIGQIRFFAVLPGSGYAQAVLYCSLASLVDGLTVITIFFVLSRIIVQETVRFYFCAAVSGALCAVLFEVIAINFGLWSYDESMPVLPYLGIGALPFIQLLILVPAAILVTGKLATKYYLSLQQ